MPLISVILTTHNRPTLLERALNSLLTQEFKDFEIIVCADEGEIHTKEVSFKLLRAIDSFISAPQIRGPAGTRNLGVSIASGQYICFLDDDDSYSSNYFLISSNFLAASNDIHYCNYREVEENREIEGSCNEVFNKRDIGKFSTETLMIRNFIPVNALFIPNLVAKANPFDIRLQSHEDWDWLISLKTKNYTFKHHDIYGPNVHLQKSPSRNNNALETNSVGLDYLSIYRKWPCDLVELKFARAEVLKDLGVNAQPQFL
jgi:glycosyltransferase involved in cell wall biosynthesis